MATEVYRTGIANHPPTEPAPAKPPSADGGSRKMLPVVLAVGAALIGFMMIQGQVRHADERAEKKYARDTVWALTAAKDLQKGNALTDAAIDAREVVKADQPWCTIKTGNPKGEGDAAKRYEELKLSLNGRVVNRNVPKGDMLLLTDLEEEHGSSLGEMLKAGQRAVLVQVDRSSMVGGLLQPNDRVDVLATYQSGMVVVGERGSGKTVPKTVVVLEDVPIAAVGSRLARSDAAAGGGGSSVVLALDPDRALLLSHVQKEATISLLLRPRVETTSDTYTKTEVGQGDVQDRLNQLRKPGGGGK